MPVIGIDQVPREIVHPSIWGDAGYAGGSLLRALLLQQLQQHGGVGQVPTSPTSQNPGTFNFPPGSQSPIEQAQIQQLGGVPTRGQPFLSRASQTPGSGVSFTQPTRLGFKPDLNYLLNQMKVQQASREMANAPLENQKLELANQTAKQQIQINEDVIKGELIPVTLPTGQTTYMRPSKSGFVPIPAGKEKSVREQVTEQEFRGLGTFPLPEELPNPKGMADGTKATDTITGQKYVIRKGAWVPL